MKLSLALLFCLGIAGCAAPAHVVETPSRPLAPTTAERPHAKDDPRFAAALASFVEHDRAADWSPAACASVAAAFEAVDTAVALVDSGLAHERCDDDQKARATFERALVKAPGLATAHAQLAILRLKVDGNANAAITTLEKAVVEGAFADVASLVALATLERKRAGDHEGPACKNDLDCARLNLQRALALDDAYMPALNELALYYRDIAHKRAREATVADVQQLELAALVCSQAIAKNPRYAPIHNTAGLIEIELGHPSAAAVELARAIELDPKLFEAHMNLAAVNLGFRGFEQASGAYRHALALRPSAYDAHIGLAVALRGQLASNPNAFRSAIRTELDAAKRIDPDRPEAYFNDGVFTMEVESDGDKTAFRRAETSFKTFLVKADAKPEYAAATVKAHQRLSDLAQMSTFMHVP